MKKKVESFPALIRTVVEESNIHDVDFTIARDVQATIKNFQESLMEFTISLTADIKNIAKGGKYEGGLKILDGDDKIFDRIVKVIAMQEALIKVLRFDPEPEETKKKTEQTRVSVEAMAK